MKNKGIVIAMVVILAAVAVGAFLITNAKDKESPDNMNMTKQQMSASSAAKEKSASSSSSATQATATTSVTIQDFAFSPKTITVKVGDTVTWTNQDSVQHDVTADDPSDFAPSGSLLSKGQSYSFKFNKAGTYSYHCTPHPYMKGTVIVE